MVNNSHVLKLKAALLAHLVTLWASKTCGARLIPGMPLSLLSSLSLSQASNQVNLVTLYSWLYIYSSLLS